jgi:hypothetical protein
MALGTGKQSAFTLVDEPAAGDRRRLVAAEQFGGYSTRPWQAKT